MGRAGAGWYKKEVAHRLLTKVVLIVLNFIKVRKIQKSIPSLALGPVDRETKLSSHNFSTPKNEQTCFFILTTRRYLKLEFRFQVSSITESSG